MLEVLSCCQVNSLVSILLITIFFCMWDPGHSIILETPVSSVVGENVLKVFWAETAQEAAGAVFPPYTVILSFLDCIHLLCFLTSMATSPTFWGFSQEEVTERCHRVEVGCIWSMPLCASHVTLMYEFTASQSNWPTITMCSCVLNKKGGWQGGLLELHKQGGTVGKRQC